MFKKIFTTKYRIVTDNYNGYEVQRKRWFSLYWKQIPDRTKGLIINTFCSFEEAKAFIVLCKEGKNKRSSRVEVWRET